LAALGFTGGREPAAVAQAPDAVRDPLFQEPSVDIDEWRDKPVRHRVRPRRVQARIQNLGRVRVVVK